MTIDTKLFETMKYRLIGPHRGGRVVAVCGVAQDRDVYYFGSTGGGPEVRRCWKNPPGTSSPTPCLPQPLCFSERQC
jgi:hypothetical protein